MTETQVTKEAPINFAEIKTKLERAQMALCELTDKYEWDYMPTPREAYNYDTTVHPSESCTEHEQWSWEYVYGYQTIMWLVNVAKDYMASIEDEIGRCAE